MPRATALLAEGGPAAGLPMASHDDDSLEVRERYRALGARICEFPMAEAVGIASNTMSRTKHIDITTTILLHFRERER